VVVDVAQQKRGVVRIPPGRGAVRRVRRRLARLVRLSLKDVDVADVVVTATEWRLGSITAHDRSGVLWGVRTAELVRETLVRRREEDAAPCRGPRAGGVCSGLGGCGCGPPASHDGEGDGTGGDEHRGDG